eukprot:superscaffoldBa00004959_g19702
MTAFRLLLVSLFCALFVYQSHGACAEVDSDTEAVAGKGFKLGCISCKKRSEVKGAANIEWYFKPKGEADFFQIYTYSDGSPIIESDQFMDRVDWNGSKRSNDIQDASIYLLNVTFNDTGTYRCLFNRVLFYENYEYNTLVSKDVHLTVVAKGTTESVALLYNLAFGV